MKQLPLKSTALGLICTATSRAAEAPVESFVNVIEYVLKEEFEVSMLPEGVASYCGLKNEAGEDIPSFDGWNMEAKITMRQTDPDAVEELHYVLTVTNPDYNKNVPSGVMFQTYVQMKDKLTEILEDKIRYENFV